MSDVRLVFHMTAIRQLESSEATAEALGESAGAVARRVRVSKRLRVRRRWGVSSRGAYSQVIIAGPGAIQEEFGSRTRAAKAPLRRALRGAR